MNKPAVYSLDAEQAVLGGLMLDSSAWHSVASLISAQDFFRKDHQAIFAAIAEIAAAGKVADVVTVSDAITRRGQQQLVSLQYLAQIVRDTPSAANVRTYASVVKERSALRQLRSLAESIDDMINQVGSRSASEVIADVATRLTKLQERSRSGKGLIDARQLAGELVDDLDRRKSGARGLSIGLSDFDHFTHGLERGDLAVFAGRPGMGKTALLVSIAAHVSRTLPVSVFTAEMPKLQLARRCLAHQSGVSHTRMRHADALTDDDWAAMDPALTAMARSRLSIDDTATPSLAHIRSEISAQRSRGGVSLALIDYIQLIRGTGANRYEQLRDIAYELKAVAKEMEIPIVVLAQLNRGVESREDKRPQISDLRDSGGIEEAADIIGLLYSEAYYDPEFSMPYVLECNLAKVRDGERAECFWHFDGARSRVEVLGDGARAQYRQLRAKAKQRQNRSRDFDL